MPDTPDMEDLARRYLDLWQENLNALAHDQDAAKVMAQTMAMMSSGAQAFASAAQSAAAAGSDHDHDPTSERAAPAAPVDGDPGLDVAELHRRLAALEGRVTALESEVARYRGTTVDGDPKPGA